MITFVGSSGNSITLDGGYNFNTWVTQIPNQQRSFQINGVEMLRSDVEPENLFYEFINNIIATRSAIINLIHCYKIDVRDYPDLDVTMDIHVNGSSTLIVVGDSSPNRFLDISGNKQNHLVPRVSEWLHERITEIQKQQIGQKVGY